MVDKKKTKKKAKKKAKTTRDKLGRPTVITPEILKQLKEAFANSFTDVEACLFVGIGTTALENYCKKNPEFKGLKEELKNKPKLRAKVNLLKAINKGDIDTSKWYLERRSREEFSTKVHQEQDGTINIIEIDSNDKKL